MNKHAFIGRWLKDYLGPERFTLWIGIYVARWKEVTKEDLVGEFWLREPEGL